MIPESIFTALGPLVGNRVYPNTFPQTVPEFTNWPAIRYTVIDSTDDPDICGSGNTDTDDVLVQVDVVAATYMAARSLGNQVIAAMYGITPKPLRRGYGDEFDAETKTHRVRIDFMFPQSSSA